MLKTKVSSERIGSELSQILAGNNLDYGLELLEKTRIVSHIATFDYSHIKNLVE